MPFLVIGLLRSYYVLSLFQKFNKCFEWLERLAEIILFFYFQDISGELVMKSTGLISEGSC